MGGFLDHMPLWPAEYLLDVVIAAAVGCWHGSACGPPVGDVWVGGLLACSRFKVRPLALGFAAYLVT